MISVCIATYNGGRYIVPQIKSILSQLEPQDEVIISDDSSTDDTVELVKSLKDKRIIVLEGQKFKNPAYNFENALRQAKGQYIFLSDQDDVWLPDKVLKMINRINFGYDLVVSDCKIVNENLVTINPSYFEFNKSKPGFINNLFKNGFMGCCMAFNRKLLDACLPFPANLPMHDSYIGLLAELKFKVSFIIEPLILHRKHSKNKSNTSTGISQYSMLKKIIFRINLIKALCVKCLSVH